MWRFLLVLAVVLLVAGCKGGGGAGSDAGLFDGIPAVGSVLSGTPGSGAVSGGATGYHNPEPSTIIMFGIGAAGLAAKLRKRKKK